MTLSGKLVGTIMRSKDFAKASGKLVGTNEVERPRQGQRKISGDKWSKDFAKASGKLVGTSMRSKDFAKASGLDLRQP